MYINQSNKTNFNVGTVHNNYKNLLVMGRHLHIMGEINTLVTLSMTHTPHDSSVNLVKLLVLNNVINFDYWNIALLFMISYR